VNFDFSAEVFFEFLPVKESEDAAPRLKNDRTEDICFYSVIKKLARLHRP